MHNHMPSGQEDFKQLRETKNIFYIDKSYFIKEWWESSYDKVTLISRPRCFGKTLNMSMLDYFFSNQYENLQYLFKDLYIYTDDQIMIHQGKYPVIYLNFGDLKTGDSNSIKNQIKIKIWQAYLAYKKNMIESDNLDISEKRFIESITYQMDDDIAIHSIQYLCSFLNKVFCDKESIVLLDEYDSIITKKLNFDGSNEIWDNVKEFYINFISSTFKDNKHMKRGLITGIMDIPLYFDFSCSNNINSYNMTSSKYWNCFGFTIEEIQMILNEYGFESTVDEIQDWYGGYKCGNVNVFNPCSITKFFNQSKRFSIYWINTSSNEFVKDIVRRGSLDIKDCLVRLIQERRIKKELNENLFLNNGYDGSDESIWTLLIYSGYLTIEKKKNSNNYSKSLYTLKMPNEEIIQFFSCLVNEWFESRNYDMNDFIDALFDINVEQMEQFVNLFFTGSFEYFDQTQTRPEIVYHSFILGLAVYIRKNFSVTLNRMIDEDGYFNVVIKSLSNKELDKCFIFIFKEFNVPHSNALNESESSFDIELERQLFNDLEKEGFESENINEFVFVYNNKECTINLKSYEDESSNVINNDFDARAMPKFDFHRKRNFYRLGDQVYVIDENGYDIYEGIIAKSSNNIYSIHYPDYPQDDEKIKGIRRIIDRSQANSEIYNKQEELRKRKAIADIPEEKKEEEEEEKNDEKKEEEEENEEN